jgi:hypothetical protein
MDNVEIYKFAKFQLEIRYMGCVKITKFDMCNGEQCKLLQPQILSVFISFVQPRI